MNVQPRLTGITTPSPETLQRLLNLKYGRAEEKPLPEIYAHNARQLIELQLREGYEVLSDGQYAWGDLFRPVYAHMEGVEVGDQTRWYETNGFCFPPKIVSDPKAGKPVLTECMYTQEIEDSKKKSAVTLPGPYTLVRMAENAAGVSEERIMKAFADQLAEIVRSFPSTVEVVEFTEPSWGYDQRTGVDIKIREGTINLAREAYLTLVAAATPRRKVLLQLPQANFTAHPEVLTLPVDGYGVDLTETVAFTDGINLRGKTLSAGVLDAWSSVPEDLDFAAERVRTVIEAWDPAQVFVTTNAQMYHTIPHAPAMEKVKELAKLAQRLRS